MRSLFSIVFVAMCLCIFVNTTAFAKDYVVHVRGTEMANGQTVKKAEVIFSSTNMADDDFEFLVAPQVISCFEDASSEEEAMESVNIVLAEDYGIFGLVELKNFLAVNN